MPLGLPVETTYATSAPTTAPKSAVSKDRITVFLVAVTFASDFNELIGVHREGAVAVDEGVDDHHDRRDDQEDRDVSEERCEPEARTDPASVQGHGQLTALAQLSAR